MARFRARSSLKGIDAGKYMTVEEFRAELGYYLISKAWLEKNGISTELLVAEGTTKQRRMILRESAEAWMRANRT